MTQANQNQNILDHPQGNTHNDYQTHTRKRSNPQSTSTSNNTTRTNTNHSSQPPIFSKPPFTKTIAPPSTSSQYDPQNNWIVD